MSQRSAVAPGLVQVAHSSAGVVGDWDEAGGRGEVTGAGKRCQVTGGDQQCGTEDGTESGHGLDDFGLRMRGEHRGDLGVEVGEALIKGQGVGGELGDDRGGDVLAGQRH